LIAKKQENSTKRVALFSTMFIIVTMKVEKFNLKRDTSKVVIDHLTFASMVVTFEDFMNDVDSSEKDTLVAMNRLFGDSWKENNIKVRKLVADTRGYDLDEILELMNTQPRDVANETVCDIVTAFEDYNSDMHGMLGGE
jgi:predicted ATP-dependent protease